jgi:membrane-bound metal-dependent hydrolase YbcI (DUF457 family)
MKHQQLKAWAIFRVLVIAVNILAVATYPQNQSNLDWIAAFIISIVFSICLFAWLAVVRARPSIDWSEPTSWVKPFFPMNKYPIRFWLLTSLSFMVAGGITIVLDMFSHNGHEAFGGTFFFWGLGIWIALKIWLKKYGRPA